MATLISKIRFHMFFANTDSVSIDAWGSTTRLLLLPSIVRPIDHESGRFERLSRTVVLGSG